VTILGYRKAALNYSVLFCIILGKKMQTETETIVRVITSSGRHVWNVFHAQHLIGRLDSNGSCQFDIGSRTWQLDLSPSAQRVSVLSTPNFDNFYTKHNLREAKDLAVQTQECDVEIKLSVNGVQLTHSPDAVLLRPSFTWHKAVTRNNFTEPMLIIADITIHDFVTERRAMSKVSSVQQQSQEKPPEKPVPKIEEPKSEPIVAQTPPPPVPTLKQPPQIRKKVVVPLKGGGHNNNNNKIVTTPRKLFGSGMKR
jgi:hypothetical protein